MATHIKTKTKEQEAALMAAFGWDSFPNGEYGYSDDRKMVEVLNRHGVLIPVHYGDAASAGWHRASPYWPKALIRELRQIAESKPGQQRPFPWPTK